MDLPALLAGVAVPSAVQAAIEALLSRKADATEAEMTERDPALDHFLAACLADPAPRPAAWDQEPMRRKADA